MEQYKAVIRDWDKEYIVVDTMENINCMMEQLYALRVGEVVHEFIIAVMIPKP